METKIIILKEEGNMEERIIWIVTYLLLTISIGLLCREAYEKGSRHGYTDRANTTGKTGPCNYRDDSLSWKRRDGVCTLEK